MNGWKASEAQADRSVSMNSGTDTQREIVVVLSDKFASCMRELARDHHVWALRTTDTESVAHQFWEEHPPLDTKTGPGGITLFVGAGEPEKDFLSILNDVELHHGLASGQHPAANVIRVLGAPASEMICDALSAQGFTRIESNPNGFLARWHRR